MRLLICFLLFVVSFVNAGNFTSAKSGAFESDTTWTMGGGRYPGDNTDVSDTFLITSGHVVTLSDNVKVDSLNGTVRYGGKLLLYGTMVLNGNLLIIDTSYLDLGATCTLDITNDTIKDNTDTYVRRWRSTGTTASNRAYVTSTGGLGRIGFTRSMNVDLDFVDFYNVGNDVRWNLLVAGASLNLNHCSFTDCGDNYINVARRDLPITLNACEFRGQNGNGGFMLQLYDNLGDSVPTASWSYDSCVFAGTMSTMRTMYIYQNNASFSNCIFDNLNLYPMRLRSGINFRNCVFMRTRFRTGAGVNIDNCYSISPIDNPHNFELDDTTTGIDITVNIDSTIIEANYAEGTTPGDLVLLLTSGTRTFKGNVNLTNNIIIDKRDGMLLNALGLNGATPDTLDFYARVVRNTVYQKIGGIYGILYFTELKGTHKPTGDSLYFLSNLCIANASAVSCRGFSPQYDNPDEITMFDNNCFFKFPDSNFNARYYNVSSATKTPGETDDYGLNDTTLNPQLVDTSRTFSSWNISYGSGTDNYDSARWKILRINGYDTTTKRQNGTASGAVLTQLISWVRGGFQPQNSVISTLSHTGGTIGAVDYVGEACTKPTGTDTSVICTVSVSVNKNRNFTDVDSAVALESFPGGLSWNKTTFALTGIPTDVERDSVNLKLYHCNGDSTDTVYFVVDIRWDSLSIDSTSHDGDTLDAGLDTLIAYGYCKHRKCQYFILDNDTIDTLWSNDSTIGAYIPDTVSEGWYQLTIEDTVSSVTQTDSFYVRIFYTASISTNPHDTTVTDGQTVYLHGTGTGTGTITYQWLCDSGAGIGTKNVVAGETNDTLTITAATAMNGWYYWLEASNTRGKDTSVTATLTVSAVVYTLTVTDAGNGSTNYTGGQAVADGDSLQVIALPDAHYHFVRWTRSTTDLTMRDSANDTQYVVVAGNGTATAYFDPDSFDVTLVDGDNVDLSQINGLRKPFGAVCSVRVDVDAGYAYRINGGAAAYADDTLLLVIDDDTTVIVESYLIPVIDSIRDSTALRDSTYRQAGRPLDTMIAHGTGFSTLGDSTYINLNSSGSLKGTIRSISNTKAVFVIPTGTPRGWYSMWIRTKDLVAGAPRRHALLVKTPGGL